MTRSIYLMKAEVKIAFLGLQALFFSTPSRRVASSTTNVKMIFKYSSRNLSTHSLVSYGIVFMSSTFSKQHQKTCKQGSTNAIPEVKFNFIIPLAMHRETFSFAMTLNTCRK